MRAAAVGLRSRADLRRRWGTWLALALVGAAVGGPTMAVVAGAWRTATAPDRFAAAQRAADVLVPNYPDPEAAQLDPDAVAAHVAVASSARFLWVYWGPGDEGVALILPRDDDFGTVMSVPTMVEGRPADPGRIDEATASYDVADRFGLSIGDEIVGFDAAVIPEVEQVGLPTSVTVVGIEARPLELGQASPVILALHGTPALYEQWHAAEPDRLDGVAVTLHGGDHQVAQFRAHLEAMGGPDAYVDTASRGSLTGELDRTARLLASGIWILAVVLAVVGVVLVYVSHFRAAGTEGDEQQRLNALGWTRADSLGTSVLRSAAVGTVSAAVAVVVAVALSPLFPLGLARVAEPDPGLRIDGAVLAAGAAATLIGTVAAGSLAGVRAAANARRPQQRVAGRRLGRLAGPSALGARFALAGGARGVARATVATVAALVLLGTLAGFATSAENVLRTPRTYGWPWQLVAERYEDVNFTMPDSAAGRAAIQGLPGVVGAAVGDSTEEDEFRVDGHRTGGFVLDAIRGDPAVAMPPITAGRLPSYAGEIALGPKLMEVAGVSLGDSVTVSSQGVAEQSLTVVGEVVIPPSHAGTAGAGVLLPRIATHELIGGAPAGDEGAQAVYLVLEPSTRPDDVLAELNDRLGANGAQRLFKLAPAEPRDVAHLLHASALPWLLAIVLAVLAATTLVSTLVTATLQRGRDVAILRALGMCRGTARRVLVAQAILLAVVALAVTIPLAVLAGRWLWVMYADQQGFLPEPTTPWGLVALAAVAIVAASALATVGPATAITARPPGRHLNRE